MFRRYSELPSEQLLIFSHSGSSDSATPWTAACQASLSFTTSWSLLTLIPPSHALPPPPLPALNLSRHQGLFPWVSSSHQVAKVLELQLQHQSSQWYSGLISFWMDWFDLLAVQGTLKSLLQHHNSKQSILQSLLQHHNSKQSILQSLLQHHNSKQSILQSLLQHHNSKQSILRCSTFFMVQLSHPYMPQSVRASLSLFCVHFTSQIHSQWWPSPGVHLRTEAHLPGQDASGLDMLFGVVFKLLPPYSVSWMHLFNFLRFFSLWFISWGWNEKWKAAFSEREKWYFLPTTTYFKKWTLKSHKDTGLKNSVQHLLPRRHSVRTGHNFFFNPRKLKHSKSAGEKIDTLLTNTFVIGFYLGYYIIVHKTELICDTRQKSRGILDTRK